MVAVIYIVLTLVCLTMLYPVLNTVAISFNEGNDTARGGLTLLPRVFTLENYRHIFKDSRLLGAFRISVMRTLIGTPISILFTALFAYGVSREELKFRKGYMRFATVTMYVNAGFIPVYLLIKSLHLVDTFWVFVIPLAFNVWNMIIFRSFFINLPDGLLEAARIDGAGEYRTFMQIVLPVSKPVIASLTLFTAVTHWNSWFDGAIYITRPALVPLQTLLRQIINSNTMAQLMNQLGGAAAESAAETMVTSRSLSAATMMVATIPIMLVYPFLQKYFVSGIMLGSIKE